ncbi:MAG TPA: cytochrome c3 family protein [Pyrinomonadaceae bacterium]|nr:cytochrome c3 family protein [Pyrinomonadaceae bacterium]
MKLSIVSAALVCFLCVVGCSALKSGSAALTAQGGQVPKDEYRLSTDSKKDKAKSLPVPFSHVNHATKNYSPDGTKTIGCVECHHTDQPAAEAAKHPPLKTAHPADRTVTLTAETAKDPKTPTVETCRACHAQEGEKPKLGAAIPEVTYEGDTDPTVLTNEEAYHRNCNTCHDAAVEKRKGLNAPSTNECAKCHTGK